jgi:hypothetical protein
MKEFCLEFGDDGRVRPHRSEGQACKTPEPTPFQTEVRGEHVRVEYTRGYFPSGVTDLFDFVSPELGTPHPLSESGYCSRFAPHETVEACGGPEAFARLFADALPAGREKELMEAFAGKLPEAGKPRRRKVQAEAPGPEEPGQEPPERPVLGENTAAAEPIPAGNEKPVSQRSLF